MLRWTLGHGVVLDLRVISSWTELDTRSLGTIGSLGCHWKGEAEDLHCDEQLETIVIATNSNLWRRTSRSLTSITSNSNSGKVYLWPKFLSPIPECP